MESKFEQSKCRFCNGFYDADSRQPICSMCHAFLYEFRPPHHLTSNSNDLGLLLDGKEASHDSGNEEPGSSDFYYPPSPPPFIEPSSDPPSTLPCPSLLLSRSPILCDFSSSSTTISLDDMPLEVLLILFAKLDDMSLWNLRQASYRSHQLIDKHVADARWASFVRLRWPLFQPHYRVTSWRLLYLNLMDSLTCHYCFERPHPTMRLPRDPLSWRYKRIACEIGSLTSDPPYGIRALNSNTNNNNNNTSTYCLASIEGPPPSPYQGGQFYILVLFPDSYPLRPPVVRFLTRILHPNISLHGDIGLDCIQYNWSSALTLEKVLISVQSLLTDPYTPVCMEPRVGRLYTTNRDRFDELAKLWTWKYACHDYLSAEFVSTMALPNYLNECSSGSRSQGRGELSSSSSSSASSPPLPLSRRPANDDMDDN